MINKPERPNIAKTPTETASAPDFVRAYRMGFAVAAVDMAERIGLVDMLNARIAWDPQQCQVSPGVRLLALIIAFLVDPMALYRLEEFYDDLDCGVLFGAQRQASDFNDDAIGRALVKFFESQTLQTYSALCQQAVTRLGLPTSATAHLDTTTITLSGQYPHPDAGAQPARGYNKDGHPENLQLVAGLVTRSDGIPLSVDVRDGNTSDTTWSDETLRQQGLSLPGDIRDSILFVADSKMVSHQTIEDCCESGILFVSRVPNTFGLEQETKATVRLRTDWDKPQSVAEDPEGASVYLGL